MHRRISAGMLRTHTCGELRKNDAGKTVTLAGWVETLRISGKIGFLLLRDRYGITQCFLNATLAEQLKDVRRESVVQVTGEVKERPDKQKKPEMATGDIELSVKEANVLSAADPLPLELDESVETSEDTRLKYRYLDLRRPPMQDMIAKRDAFIHAIREHLHQQGFLEVSTPVLTKSTPEGARDFLVPSRLHRGKFYALPQSPQQYKQLLMVAGADKYFQIAPCFRDEDARADRSPGEFYQLDLEMSFPEQEDVLRLTEELFTKVVTEVFPDKRLTTPFPRLTYKQAMEKYGTDKPDLRKDKNDPDEMAFCWVVDFPLFEPELEDGHYAPMHHMFTMPHEDDLPLLKSDPGKARSYQHDLVLNGFEVGGGSIRIHDAKIQEKIFELIGFSKEQEEYFAHMLEAFRYGVPPHGGIAPGIDRMLMVLMGKKSIREVIAFPKNKDARDVMMDAPSTVDKGQLDDLGIALKDTHHS